MTTKIKVDRQAARFKAHLLTPETPGSEELVDMVRKCAMLDEHDRNDAALAGLLKAYVACLEAEAYEDTGEEVDLGLVDDGPAHDRTYAAEKIWRKYVVLGYLAGLPKEWRENLRAAEDSENECYDRCSWYSLDSELCWPPNLLAEIAFTVGVRDAIQAEQMRSYHLAQTADAPSEGSL